MCLEWRIFSLIHAFVGDFFFSTLSIYSVGVSGVNPPFFPVPPFENPENAAWAH